MHFMAVKKTRKLPSFVRFIYIQKVVHLQELRDGGF